MYCDNKREYTQQLTSDFFEGQELNLEENIDKGMPIQDDQESIRTGNSLQESEPNVQDQIGNGFFKLNYP
jgi:hypothetical protein